MTPEENRRRINALRAEEAVKPTVGKGKSSYRTQRRREVQLRKLGRA